MSDTTTHLGADSARVEGPAKVTGRARYASEYPLPGMAYVYPVGAPVARGKVRAVDTAEAEAVPGVLGVLWHGNAPQLSEAEPGGLSLPAELQVLQSDEVLYHGHMVAAVVAETTEAARHAAELLRTDIDQSPHDVEFFRDRDDFYTPEDSDEHRGDPDAQVAGAHAVVDEVYGTAMQHNNPMEPHSTIAEWDAGGLTLHESTQGPHVVRETLAPMVGLDPEQVHVIAPFVGGGFGSKGPLHAPTVVAVLAARAFPGRPVKLLLPRQRMFDQVGYRSPTSMRVRLTAGADGVLTGISVDAAVQSSRVAEFIETAAAPARMMYAAPHRRSTHAAVTLDAAPPTWMRAPGECPGMFGPEVAMDELACTLGIDPIELRVRNEPDRDPSSGLPYSSRNLVACMHEGARRFGWADHGSAPGTRRDGEWLVGTGVASSTYPAMLMPGSSAVVRHLGEGRYEVGIGAADIGTGAETALGLIAAEALEVPTDRVRMRIGDTEQPTATVAGGSTGTVSWGSAITAAAQEFRKRHGTEPEAGAEAAGDAAPPEGGAAYSSHGFGAQFAEVRVHAHTGEVRVPRLLGVWAVGRVISARTAHSQFLGGMVMGLSMALHESSEVDPRTGHVVNRDLADYHIAANADIGDIQAHWIDEHDPYVNALGAKGIGEIGIVGTAAAIANAAHHATGVRVRDLPLTPDRFI